MFFLDLKWFPMKTNALKPVGILGPRRQRQILDGLQKRFSKCQQDLSQLASTHRQEMEESEEALRTSREEVLRDCRQRRRDMLEEWDLKQETCISEYETQVAKGRDQLSRLAVLYRRKLDEQTTRIEKEGKQKKEALLREHTDLKNLLHTRRRQNAQSVEEMKNQIDQQMQQVDALVLRRLERLPLLDKSSDDEKVQQSGFFENGFDLAVYTDHELSQINAQFQRLKETKLARVTESWFLPCVGVVLALVWAVISYGYLPAPPDIPHFVWLISGVVSSGVVSFIVYVTCMFPLKKQTLEVYPEICSMTSNVQSTLAQYKEWTTQKSESQEQKLEREHRDALEAVSRWCKANVKEAKNTLESDQSIERERIQSLLEKLDSGFVATHQDMNTVMRENADELAEEISKNIAEVDKHISTRRETVVSDHEIQIDRLKKRIRVGFEGVSQKITKVNKQVLTERSNWAELALSPGVTREKLDYLTLGSLNIGGWMETMSEVTAATVGDALPGRNPGNAKNDDWGFGIPKKLPVVLHRRLHSGILLTADRTQMQKAIDFVHQILWQLLSSVRPSRSKLVLIDPLGRGQHFTNFMALADYDPQLVGHRVWTTEETIEKRLGELAHHAEDVLLSCLRDRFACIEDYNQAAGALAEPYTCVAAIGFPLGLTRTSYRHLNALIENGSRCGNKVIVVADRDSPWPSDMPALEHSRLLHLDLSEADGFRVIQEQLDQFSFSPAVGPNSEQRSKLVRTIGEESINASRVEVPLGELIDEGDEQLACTDDGIKITLGTQGAGRPLSLAIGEGVKQHVLIAGKTGSGKSTLLHALITAGAMKYQPDQLHYYLLDFKKGVEFKAYADQCLPHARVIGIESEREFGKSVLQRLDRELRDRGEAFREQGVQSLAQYREKSKKTLPRVVLVVDEFQELFVRDDRLASECTMLLDRIVRQGRSFGLHVILSSQSLAGAYSLPRATLGQMAIRIAMQCSESDAALILSDENTAAKWIKRPGEAIYNDAGGLLEGNQPFQAAWVSSEEHDRLLLHVTGRDKNFESQFPARVIFEGNRPSRWTPTLADEVLASGDSKSVVALVGEAVEIGPPVSIHFRDDPARNILVVAGEEIRLSIQTSLITSLLKSQPESQFRIFEGHRSRHEDAVWEITDLSRFNISVVKPRECEREMLEVGKIVKERSASEQSFPPMFIFIDPLERFRELRQEEGYSFSLGGESDTKNPSVAFQEVLRDGPSVNVFCVVACASVETLSRWLPRASHRDIELRLLGQMNPSDSAFLMDSSEASDLTASTVLLYDDSDGSTRKCRVLNQPDQRMLCTWLAAD